MTSNWEQIDAAARRWVSELAPHLPALTQIQRAALGAEMFGIHEKFFGQPYPKEVLEQFLECLSPYGARFGLLVFTGQAGTRVPAEETIAFGLAARSYDWNAEEISEHRLSGALSELKAYLESDSVNVEATAELHGFAAAEEVIQLDDRTSIVPNRLLSHLYRSPWDLPPSHRLRAAARVPLGFGQRAPTATEDETLIRNLEEHVQRAARALHLSQSGSFTLGQIWITRDSWVAHGGLTSRSVPQASSLAHMFTLDERKVPLARRILAIAAKVDESGHPKHLPLAFRRFYQAMLRDRYEDRLIDLMVAAEALLLPGITDELSFRLALRTAGFLGVDLTSMESIRDQMRGAYRIRNSVVHGEIVSASDVISAAKQAEGLVRQALLKAFELVEAGHIDALNEWDELRLIYARKRRSRSSKVVRDE